MKTSNSTTLVELNYKMAAALLNKKSELFEIDGLPFRVMYAPRAMYSYGFGIAQNVETGKSIAYYPEDVAKALHEGFIEYNDKIRSFDKESALTKLNDFLAVCILFTHKELMIYAIQNAPKKKDGTLYAGRVNHITWTGVSVNGKFYELCSVNETENVISIEIRSTEARQRNLDLLKNSISCKSLLEKWNNIEPYSFEPEEEKGTVIDGGFRIDGKKLLKYEGHEKIVTIPDGITNIGVKAFAREKFIEKVIMPDSVKTISAEAFSGCSNLREIHFSKHLNSIGLNAFRLCKSIESLDLPRSVKKIKAYAFGGCHSLREINGLGNVKEIDREAFLFLEHIKHEKSYHFDSSFSVWIATGKRPDDTSIGSTKNNTESSAINEEN